MSRPDQALRRKRRKERRYLQQRERFYREELDDSVPTQVRVNGYTVTYDALNRFDGTDPIMGAELTDFRARLHGLLTGDAAVAVVELEAALARFPDSPTLMNWLAAAYGRNDQVEKSEALSLRNYQLYPNYLFGRINHAHTLVHQGKLEEAAEVMEHKWDLKALRPDLDLFHYTEFVAMSYVAIEYFMRTGDIEKAESIYDKLEQLAPNHEVTKLLQPLVEGYGVIRVLKQMSWRLSSKSRLP
jgi:tetratricopeptide (TPR) repeat protein